MLEAGSQFPGSNGQNLRSPRDTLECLTQPVAITRHDGDVQAA
jgi:hypothetical protein